MALIKCPECGKEISDQAASCPSCGFKIKKFDVAKHKKRSTWIILIGLALCIVYVGWSVATSDSDLLISAGYYFGGGDMSAYNSMKARQALQELVCDVGGLLMLAGVIYKIVIAIKKHATH